MSFYNEPKGIILDSGQFLFSVISNTLDRELDRKQSLETKAMSLFRLWIFLITTFTTVMIFFITFNSDAIRSFIDLNNHWLCFLVIISCVMISVLSYLLYLIIKMSNIVFGISDKNTIRFDPAEIDNLLNSDLNLLRSNVFESLNISIKDYGDSNKVISDSIKKLSPIINNLLFALFMLIILFTLIIIIL
jgi:hypothetical protein